MQKKIDSYVFRKDNVQVIMDADVAEDIKIATEAYQAGVKAGGHSYANCNIELFTGRYIAEKFLDDESSKNSAQEAYAIFYKTVKAKVEELTEK